VERRPRKTTRTTWHKTKATFYVPRCQDHNISVTLFVSMQFQHVDVDESCPVMHGTRRHICLCTSWSSVCWSSSEWQPQWRLWCRPVMIANTGTQVQFSSIDTFWELTEVISLISYIDYYFDVVCCRLISVFVYLGGMYRASHSVDGVTCSSVSWQLWEQFQSLWSEDCGVTNESRTWKRLHLFASLPEVHIFL